MAGSGSKVLLVVKSRGDRSIAHAIGFQLHRQEYSMTSVCNFSRVSGIVAVAGGWLAVAGAANLHAQVPAALYQSAVTVSASSTVTVQNDRLQAWLRTEAESANPAAAANQVNTAMAKALASAKAYPAVKVATAGYSTQQVSDKQKPSRWRVAQTLSLDSGDFTAAATLISRLQDDDGLLLSGMGFSLGNKTRRDAEDSVTQQAIKSWQARAQQAANGLGFAGWHPGHVTVQTGDGGRVYPMMRAQAMSSGGSAPVAIEAGTTDVSVTVSGEAILDSASGPTR
jgi:predicted secreted protein